MPYTDSTRKALIAQRMRAKEIIRNLRAEMTKDLPDITYASVRDRLRADREMLNQTLYFLERTE